MRNLNDTTALKEKIVFLQRKQAQELAELKTHLNSTYESVKPVNVIKNTLQEIAASPDIKDNVFNSIIGLTTGYISTKVLMGSSHNPVRRVLRVFLQYAITNIVAKHSEGIKATGVVLWNRIVRQYATKKQSN